MAHKVKKIGLIDGANATINADTATYHPSKILDQAPVIPKYSFGTIAVRDATTYNPTLLTQGKMNASVDILGEFRDIRQIFMLLGAVSNGGDGTNETHAVTTHTSRPNRPQTVYTEASGGSEDVCYKWKNCRIQRIEINSTKGDITTIKHSFALGEPATNTKLTTYPVAYPTEDDAPFIMDNNSENKWATKTIGGMQMWQLVLERVVDPKYYHQTSGEHYPYYNDAQPVKCFGSFIHVNDSANDNTLFANVLAGTKDTLHFKLYKSTNNHVTFSLANTLVEGGEIQLPTVGGESVSAMVYGFWATTPTITEASQVVDAHYT